MKWWYTIPFFIALINAPFIEYTWNAISFGFCIGVGFTIVLPYFIRGKQ